MLPAGTASCSGLINALRDHVTMLATKKDLETKIAERTRHLRQLASDATTPGSWTVQPVHSASRTLGTPIG